MLLRMLVVRRWVGHSGSWNNGLGIWQLLTTNSLGLDRFRRCRLVEVSVVLTPHIALLGNRLVIFACLLPLLDQSRSGCWSYLIVVRRPSHLLSRSRDCQKLLEPIIITWIVLLLL